MKNENVLWLRVAGSCILVNKIQRSGQVHPHADSEPTELLLTARAWGDQPTQELLRLSPSFPSALCPCSVILGQLVDRRLPCRDLGASAQGSLTTSVRSLAEAGGFAHMTIF